MSIAKLALMLVVFVDLMGQGLIFPIINTLMLDTDRAFLPAGTSTAARHFDYGIVMAVFYVAWFFGAAYISRVSDMIGRKPAIMVCLVGGFAGYGLTILALMYNSLWLLILGRAITGFTAGNQPVVQAAVVDLSENDADRARNMGYYMVAGSAGLIAGPLIGGLLSDTALLGSYASLQLPFYVAAGLIALTALLVVVTYSDAGQPRQPFRFEPLEIFLVLWRVTQRPVVLRIAIVFFVFEIVLNAFYIFMDTYMSTHFGYGTLGTSMAMLAFGACLAFSGAFLVPYLSSRVTLRAMVGVSQAIIGLCCLAFVLVPSGLLSFVPIVLIGLAFGVGYPILLTIFSLCVGEEEQGWVMGVSTALFTLGAALTSLIGGEAMGVEARLPFLGAAALSIVSLLAIRVLWSFPGVQAIVSRRPEAKPAAEIEA